MSDNVDISSFKVYDEKRHAQKFLAFLLLSLEVIQ